MKWKIASASARGSSHVRSGRPNQDACEHGTGSPGGPLKAVLAVSDGHGGARHFRSEIGSRLAAHIAVSVIEEAISLELPDEAVPPLARRMVDDWRTAVLSDLEQHPFTPAELASLETAEGLAARESVEQDPALAYGATLLVAAATSAYLLYLQLGDGDILAVDASGKTYRPLIGDERLIGNQTTSLCQPEAWKEFRSIVARNPAEFAAVVLASTDGYANSFRSEEDFLKIGRDYLNLIREDGLDALAEELPAILAEASEKGSGDDITLSILVSDAAYATPAPVVAAVKRPANRVPGRIISEYIRSERGTAEYKVPDIRPVRRSPRFSAGQIRVLAVVVVILVGAFLIQRYSQRPKQPSATNPVNPPAPPANTPGKLSSNAPPRRKEWMLHMGTASPIALRAGAKISTKELFHTPDGVAYAEVAENDGVLRLMNLTEDLWTEERPGKPEKPVHDGDGVELGAGVKIILRGKTAIIALGDAPSTK